MGKSQALVIQNWIKDNPFFQRAHGHTGHTASYINAQHHTACASLSTQGEGMRTLRDKDTPKRLSFLGKNWLEVTKVLWPGKFEMVFLLQKWTLTNSNSKIIYFFPCPVCDYAIHPRPIYDVYGKYFLPFCTCLFNLAGGVIHYLEVLHFSVIKFVSQSL